MPADVSKAELAVLTVLWKKQPLSVREVHDLLDTNWAYTTTKTVMDRMAKKDLLKRETAHGVNIYTPLVSRAEGMVQWVKFFADQVLGVGYDEVLNLFDRRQQYSRKELDELAELLKEADNPKQE